MVTPEIYMEANGPTVAEGAIAYALWYGTPPGVTVQQSIDHAAQYGIPREVYRAEIMRHLSLALSGPEGFSRFVRSVLWRYPGVRSVSKYIERELEETLTPAQIIRAINQLH